MIHYINTIDELIDIVDREFSGANAVCPICKKRIGTVDIPDVELGIPELKFTHIKYPGVYCIEGHCIISMEVPDEKEEAQPRVSGTCRIYIEDLGIKVYEVMKLIKPYLDIDKSIPNSQIYWMLLDSNNPLYLQYLSYDDALELKDKLQKLGAKPRIV